MKLDLKCHALHVGEKVREIRKRQHKKSFVGVRIPAEIGFIFGLAGLAIANSS